MGRLGELIVPCPPFHLQQKFSESARSVETTLKSLVAAADKIDALFFSLLDKAFSGQLTAQWRQAHMAKLLVEMQQQAKALSLPMPKEHA
jgi:type I restriction enzyme S subunit